MRKLLAVLLAMTLLFSATSAMGEGVETKAATVGDVVTAEIEGGSILIGANYMEQNGRVFPHTGKLLLTGTSTNNTVTVLGNVKAEITLDDLNINLSGTPESASPFALRAGADVTLTLRSTNRLIGYVTALETPMGAKLTIRGDGSLRAVSMFTGAGIGSSDDCGDITIAGGDITAMGARICAGIGGGYQDYGGNIVISGGEVYAKANGTKGAGIGAGYQSQSGCSVTIKGGGVYAVGSADGGAGIGGGYECDNCLVTISGGDIIALSGTESSAGIGGGGGENGTAVRVSGGHITALGGSKGAGIGGGENSTGASVIITGGSVMAGAGETGAGIGAGANATGAKAVISGKANIEAQCDGTGIGGDGCEVYVTGKSVRVNLGTSPVEGTNVYLNAAGIIAGRIVADTLTLTGSNTLTLQTAPTASRGAVSVNAIAGKGKLKFVNGSGVAPKGGEAVVQAASAVAAKTISLGDGFTGHKLLVDGTTLRLDTADSEVFLTLGGKKIATSFEDAVARITASDKVKPDGKPTQAKIVLRKDATYSGEYLLKPMSIDGQGRYSLIIPDSMPHLVYERALALSNIKIAHEDGSVANVALYYGGRGVTTIKNVTAGEISAEPLEVSGKLDCTLCDSFDLTLKGATVVADSIHATRLKMNGKNTLRRRSGSGSAESLLRFNNVSPLITGSGTLTLSDLPGNIAAGRTVVTSDVYEAKLFAAIAKRVKLGERYDNYRMKADNENKCFVLDYKDPVVTVGKGKKTWNFDTFNAAVTYVNEQKLSGCVITLMRNTAYEDMIRIKVPCTVDGRNHTLDGTLELEAPAKLTNIRVEWGIYSTEFAQLTLTGDIWTREFVAPVLTLDNARIKQGQSAASVHTFDADAVWTLIGDNVIVYTYNIVQYRYTKSFKMQGSGRLTLQAKDLPSPVAGTKPFASEALDVSVFVKLKPGFGLEDYRFVKTDSNEGSFVTIMPVFNS